MPPFSFKISPQNLRAAQQTGPQHAPLLRVLGWCGLEDGLQAELQAAAANAIRGDVASKSVATVIVLQVIAERTERNIRDSPARNSSAPLAIEQVERFRLELQGESFGQLRVFEDAEIDGTYGLW